MNNENDDEFTCGDDSKYITIFALIISSVSTITIGFYVYQKSTKLRILLFLTSIMITISLSINIMWEIMDCEYKSYYYLFHFVTFIAYILVVTWCFVDIGKEFYTPSQRITPLLKFTIAGAVICALTGAVLVVFYLRDEVENKEKDTKYILTLFEISLGWITLFLAFIYTFKPIIKFRITQRRQNSTIDPRNSAVGIWYLMLTTLIGSSYLSFIIFYIVKGIGNPKIFLGPDARAIDYFHRTLLILNFSLPPPKFCLNLIGRVVLSKVYTASQNNNNRNNDIFDNNNNNNNILSSDTIVHINNNNIDYNHNNSSGSNSSRNSEYIDNNIPNMSSLDTSNNVL